MATELSAEQSDQPTQEGPSYSLGQLTRYMLGLGTWGFGGPVALVGYMHRDLVEHRRWITEADYKEGLTLAQLMPGPLAAQLAIYLGYVHYKVLGATIVGLTFVLPSFDAYYGPFERGGASTGQLLSTLPEAARHAVREEIRQALNDTGGPIEIDVEHRIASGRRPR